MVAMIAPAVWRCHRCPQVLGEIVDGAIVIRIRRERDRHIREIRASLPCTQTCPSCGAQNTYPPRTLDDSRAVAV